MSLCVRLSPDSENIPSLFLKYALRTAELNISGSLAAAKVAAEVIHLPHLSQLREAVRIPLPPAPAARELLNFSLTRPHTGAARSKERRCFPHPRVPASAAEPAVQTPPDGGPEATARCG